ncbi:endonuclease/exonuclease/phosphatase family protein [Moorena producens JHB]|uniref:Endonuclease/exonuclease/phosphatase family protein n=1 Tax=Moorena producens (strain JHB) TaxID=1454205 RepID=A0A1D9G2H0_MOOP1|nr:endonuclease/exonuclease/phosphatase family protein [Moorena producens]AOY81620.1 endonuclease/exonuclease/phosphatase family protein [Moorena producens JHB]
MTNRIIRPIYDIQGEGHISPFVGQSVTTTGIVTGVASNGFYLQDPYGDNNDATSDGIFVFTNSAPTVRIRDKVQVSGDVQEFRLSNRSDDLTLTQITNLTNIRVLSSNNPLPTAVVIGEDRTVPTEIIDDDGLTDFNEATDSIDFYESLEGMRVQINNAVAVAPTNRFGEIWTVPGDVNPTGVNNRGGITISDGDFNPERIQIDDTLLNGTSPIVNVGDELGTVTGVLSYSFGNFELQSTEPIRATSGNLTPEITNLVSSANQVTIASFNVENLDPNSQDRDDDIGDGKFNAIAFQVINNLQSPDIIALQEVQDNNGTIDDGNVDARETYETLINAIVAAGGPQYSFFDIPPVDRQDGGQPGGNIRVGYLYNPNRVTINTDSAQRIGVGETAFDNTRKSLLTEFEFNGETISVINNHFSSKGGSDPLFGENQPPQNGQEQKRNQQAQIVNDFVDTILTNDPDANVVVLGDFNTFDFEEPLETLKGAHNSVLTNLTETLPEDERYTFIFEGNSQALDHILVSDNLVNARAEYDIVHVNSEFADQASDHDPILARFTLPEPTIINGTAGSEKLTGTENNDIITGFQGRDLLTGDGGNDQFVYTSQRDAGDLITDFEMGSDKIVLTELFNNNGITVANYADAINRGFLSFASQDNYAVVLFDKDGSGDSNYQGVFRKLEQEFPFPSLNTNSDGSQIFLVLENVDVVELHDYSNFVI